MSDDGDGGEDYGDFEDLGSDQLGENEGLDEDDAGSSSAGSEAAPGGADWGSEDGSSEGGPEGEAPEGEGESPEEEPAAPAAASARPERPKGDPLLRISNRPRVVRVVPAEERVTDGRLHKTEAAYLVAMRAEQIAKYATCFTDGGGLRDPVALAFKELLDRRCPLVIRRQVGVGPGGELLVEDWSVREMALPPLVPPGDN